ncbi:TonB-dependent receptor [Adhaeribacter aquaticus]|uniref:TonB-dependent receptor n=1 Tax=Adhaeribacter aquaticus TaxID=299567 RepID=UPI00040E7E47|nr:TonB-dependent receptor [Adhaeribacter aquaticus]
MVKFYYSLLVGLFISCSLTIPVFAQNKSNAQTDSLKRYSLTEVVVSASRFEENILKSPVSIQKIDGRTIRLSAAPSFFDALEHVKGVQIITPSLGFKVINTRGFANTTNVRFVQLVDGIDNQAPHIGGPIGNALGPSDLDIASVEIISGTASALYGMNAVNGLANFITKSPFSSTGFTMQQKTGFNHINNSNSNPKLFTETSLRYAKALLPKVAFKVNGTFTRGYDWIANNRSDLNPIANATIDLTGTDNPAYDPVNGYGNESPNRRTLTLQGKSYVVTRSGYFEKEVADYQLQNIKADAALHYRINPQTEITYTYRFALLDNVYQRSNRFQLNNYMLQQHSIRLDNPTFQFKTYFTTENTGQSYNLRSIAENLDRSFKSDDAWFSQYSSTFNQTVANELAVAQAHATARNQADAGRLTTGTPAFDQQLQKLANINNWDIGAALRVKANLLHTEGQVNLLKVLHPKLKERNSLAVLAGFDQRTYIVIPDGNYFINPDKGKADHHLTYSKAGAFLQVSKALWSKKLKLNATLRADISKYYAAKVSPRFTAVFSPGKLHYFRASYQGGFRFPGLFEAFSNVNSGGVKRVGGVPAMSNGIFENGYIRSSIDAFQAAVIRDVNANGLQQNEAIVKNKNLLKKNDYTYLEPEHIRSFEVGYKTLVLNSRLLLDVDFYFNRYSSFIAQVEINIPKTSIPDSISFYLNERKLQNRYRMWTNSKSRVYNYGGSAGLRYLMGQGFLATGNVSYANLSRTTTNDGLEDGFNTPNWITNVAVGNEKVYKNIGFNISYKWQSKYYWQSFLINGYVPGYGTLDGQITYNLPKQCLQLKAGGANLLNNYYYSFLGGPQIGGMYYVSLTYGLSR